MTTRISLSNLPEYALDKTIEKYTHALTEEYPVWAYCSICAEIDSILSGDDGCEILCPLYPSGWCMDDPADSRLYHPTDTDLKDYLWWVTIELELMRTKCERRWGGAW